MKAEWTNSDSLTTSQTTKAILLIDKPESCTSCLLGIYNKKWFCLDTNKDIDITDRYNIPEWCPLKPMPQKKSIELACQKEDDGNDFGAGLIVGWNDCIAEITGETE